MSDNDLPLKEFAVDDDDMAQYLELAGVVNEKHPAQVGMVPIEQPVKPIIQQQSVPTIPQMKKPTPVIKPQANTSSSIETLKSRQALTNSYLDIVNEQENIDENYIHQNFPAQPNLKSDELKKYDVDENEMDIYTDMLNDGLSEMINPNSRRKQLIERLREENEMISEDYQEDDIEQLDYEDGEEEEQISKITTALIGNKPIRDISKVQDTITDVESILKKIITKKYGSRNATIINKLLEKMTTIIDTVDDSEILDFYSEHFSAIDDLYSANEMNKNNFRKFVDFIDSFDYYLSEISSDENAVLSDETIDLITVVSKLSEML